MVISISQGTNIIAIYIDSLVLIRFLVCCTLDSVKWRLSAIKVHILDYEFYITVSKTTPDLFPK